MESELELKCKCGHKLWATESLRHQYYVCSKCEKLYAKKGTKHFFKCDEIDPITGEIIILTVGEK
jgi:hypothetical protein